MADDPAVPYQALYRRFRPQRFEEVLGQAHVTRPLRAAVRDGKVAHAYLFSGPRGTGKTSTARILAMALNCELPEDGEPDGTCDSCVAIRLGSSMDVQELDAASNRRIDDVRDLLSRVALGTPGRSKIYIVDEVHQLTSDASTALLKTLEDPPRHVTFVLATTDPQKVLPTIRSRTQHFEFRLLGSDVLGSLLRDVVGKAELDLPPEAIDLVVRRGHGSARDALSALDQVAAAGTAEDEAAVVPDLVDAIADQDAARLLLSVAEAAEAGLDPRRLANDLLEYLRNGFLATRARSLVMLADDAAAQAEAQARRLGPAALVRAMTTVGQALIDMRDAADPRTTLEVALVRLADPDIDDSRAALLVRIERLEQALGQRGGPVPPPARPVPGSPPPTHPEPRPRSDPPSTGRPPTPSGNPAGGSALGAHRAPRGATRPAPAGPGLAGAPGLAGESGSAGAPRSAGRSGSAGAPGSAGTPGSPGAPSSDGRSGSAGEPGSRAPQGRAGPAAASAASGEGTSADEPGPPAAPAGPGAGPAPAVLPSREELTLAWGDRILAALRPGVKVFVALGRFVSVGESAVYAVPDKGLLARAMPFRGEIETALADHFGRPVPIELVLDEGAGLDASGGAPAPPSGGEGVGVGTGTAGSGRTAAAGAEGSDDPADYDLTELEDAPTGVISAERRLLEAFPGAEEVPS